MTISKITDYIGSGTHAARPATPNVPAGATAIYAETDSGNSFAWTGSAWQQINGGAGASVVQVAVNANTNVSNGATFATAPTAGNLLWAFVADPAAGIINGSGWTKVGSASGAVDDYSFGYKIAGVGESTTQIPCTDGNPGCVVIFELANASFGVSGQSAGALTATQTVNFQTFKPNQLCIGVIDCATTGLTLSSVSGMDTHTYVTGTNRDLVWFTVTPVTSGAKSATANMSGSSWFEGVVCPVG